MREEELRGAILQRLYDYRHRGILQLTDILAAAHPAEPLLVASISERMAQAGLIEWKTSKSMGAIGGIGRITAVGIDVVEGRRDPSITLSLRDRGVVGGAPATPRTSAAVPSNAGQLDKALAAVDKASAPEAEKAAAKTLIRQLRANPLAWSVLEAMFGAGSQD